MLLKVLAHILSVDHHRIEVCGAGVEYLAEFLAAGAYLHLETRLLLQDGSIATADEILVVGQENAPVRKGVG
jgi:hypothetical protein